MNGSWEYGYLGWRVVEERAAQASAPAAQYVWGDYLDELWTVDRCDAGQNSVADFNDGAGDERLFALAGPLYHASGLADETGTLREAWEYTPYGRHTLIADGPDAADQAVNFTADDVRTPGGRSALGNPFLYTGQRHDPETGWHYYKNRYYSPALGRFASRDPIGVWGDRLALGNGYWAIGLRGLDSLGLSSASGGCGEEDSPVFSEELPVEDLPDGLSSGPCKVTRIERETRQMVNNRYPGPNSPETTRIGMGWVLVNTVMPKVLPLSGVPSAGPNGGSPARSGDVLAGWRRCKCYWERGRGGWSWLKEIWKETTKYTFTCDGCPRMGNTTVVQTVRYDIVRGYEPNNGTKIRNQSSQPSGKKPNTAHTEGTVVYDGTKASCVCASPPK